MPTSLLSPSMKRYAAGLRCVLQIFTFFPIKLASMRPFTFAIVEFSSAYAEQNERDYKALAKAVKSGKIVAETGV